MKYKILKGQVTQNIDGKTVIFDSDKSVLYTFNETASFVYKLLKKGFSEKEISAKLAAKYKITPKRAEKDVMELTAGLLAKKIISKA